MEESRRDRDRERRHRERRRRRDDDRRSRHHGHESWRNNDGYSDHFVKNEPSSDMGNVYISTVGFRGAESDSAAYSKYPERGQRVKEITAKEILDMQNTADLTGVEYFYVPPPPRRDPIVDKQQNLDDIDSFVNQTLSGMNQR